MMRTSCNDMDKGYRMHRGTGEKMEVKLELKVKVETSIVVEGGCLAVGISATLSVMFCFLRASFS